MIDFSVGRVRAIFKLPDVYGFYEHPLLYVEWFTPLHKPVPGLGLHLISQSTHQHRWHASIIPATQLVRSCHLYPFFGRSVNNTWTSDNVLDLCPKFYLNSYLRHDDFVFFGDHDSDSSQ